MSKMKDGIASVLQGLLGGIEQENVDGYTALSTLPEVANATVAAQTGDFSTFHHVLMYPLDNFVDGLLATAVPQSSETQFILKHSSFVENHYQHIITKLEGHVCCADKSSTIMSALLKFYVAGTPIAFDHTQAYTYHLPKTVFTTHEVIVEFFSAIHRLYYGQPEQYLAVMLKIMSPAASNTQSVQPN